jgi:hypothetical protein
MENGMYDTLFKIYDPRYIIQDTGYLLGDELKLPFTLEIRTYYIYNYIFRNFSFFNFH